MIIQITLTRNECFLIKELLPIWSKHVDGFVFYNDDSTDDTLSYLTENKEKYNILTVLTKQDDIVGVLKNESHIRQQLYDEALKHTNKIVCLDTDEYLDGSMTKNELNLMFESHPDTTFYFQWVQYANKNTLRVDGTWQMNFTDRAGSYIKRNEYAYRQMHSTHLPPTSKSITVNPSKMFVAHLQWTNKRRVGIKQYFWKVTDYVNKKLHNADVVGSEAYDNSVNNFKWEYSPAPYELKVRDDIFEMKNVKENDRLQFIVKYTNLYDIPNLGDWGMGIYDYCVSCKNQENKN